MFKVSTSVEKVWRVFDAFRQRGAMGISEIAEHTGLLPSDVHRLVKSLEQFGFIEQHAGSKKYRLGLELLKLGHLVHERLELREMARSYMQHLADSTQATVNLAVFDPRELEVIFVEQVDSPGEFQIRLRIGAKVAPHATGVGKVLAAAMERPLARQLLRKNGMSKRTRNTITDMAKMERELDRVAEDGYATDREEGVLGACCVAAPVYDHSGKVVAALSISTMASQMSNSSEPKLIAAVKSTAAKISGALGYHPLPSAERYGG